MISAGFEQPRDASTGKRGRRRQFRLKIAIDESYGAPQARRVLAAARLADIVAMRDALVAVGRGAQAEFLMRKAGAVAGDEEKFQFAIAAANVVMTRPKDKASEASTRFVTWGQLARAWGSQELARLYPNAGYGKKSAEATDEPRIEYLCKYIEHVPLATFNDDDYWRGMRPARERCKTDSTFKAYAQVARRVLKIAVELRIIPAWPLSAVCKLPIVAKGEAPEFPFLYPEEYCRLMRCELVPLQYRVLWGFIIREGLRLGEAFRIRWEHLAMLPAQHGMRARWVLNVPETKTGRALMFVLNAGSGEVLDAFRRLRPESAGPFVWLSATNLKKAADTLRRHVEQSGTTRERLLFTEGRLRRLREHDLRSTFVSASKLAGVDNETIAQHTGHESNVMIARYNRSKATIEHLGLAPYLPLDQAMGLDVAGELGAELLVAEGVNAGLGQGPASSVPGADLPGAHLLGAGETSGALDETSGARDETSAAAGETSPPVSRQTTAVAASPGAAPAGARRPAAPAASGDALCPECERPMARVRSESGRNGWTCPSCNAAGDAEGDWLEPVTPPLAPPARPAHGQLTASSRPGRARRRGARGQRAAAAAVAYAGDAGGDLGHANAAPKSATPMPVAYAGDRRPPLGHPPEHIEAAVSVGNRSAAPLNSCNPCDPGCDPGLGAEGASVVRNGETSMFYAAVREGRVELPYREVLEPKSEPQQPERTKPGEIEAEPAPERAGSDRGSHPGVTLLGQLQAAHRQASEEFNWTAARSLEPLIEAERVRLSNEAAARRAQAEPVRLEVVRAQREDRGGRR
jgi:integrase